MTSTEALQRLAASPHWADLTRLRPQFDLFDALGLVVNENASSRALAWLLTSDNPHGVGGRLLPRWLAAVQRERPAETLLLLGFRGDRTVAACLGASGAGGGGRRCPVHRCWHWGVLSACRSAAKKQPAWRFSCQAFVHALCPANCNGP